MKEIVLENVYFEKNGRTILEDINLEIETGEFVFLVGPTGAGKSSLLKLLYFEEYPTKGKLQIMGYNYRKINKKTMLIVRKNLGIVFQDLRLLNDRTAYDNVVLPLEIDRTHSIHDRVHDTLRKLGILHKASNYAQSLSQGERQKVAIARALVRKPRIFIADEPTAHIYKSEKPDIIKMFMELNSHGTTCIIATHDNSIVDMVPYAIRIHIENGRVEYL